MKISIGAISSQNACLLICAAHVALRTLAFFGTKYGGEFLTIAVFPGLHVVHS